VPEVVTLGETLAVLVATSPGPLRYSTHFELRTGGAESTFAVGIVRLGHSAGWISRLGNDEFGKLILAMMRGEGVDVSQVKLDSEAPTGVFFKERREAGESRNYYYRQNSAASKMKPEDIDPQYICSAKYLHLTGITPALSPSCLATVERAMDIAKECGVLISFDPNLRLKLWKKERAIPVLLNLIRKADILFPGIEEAQILLGENEPEKIVERFLELGPSIVALKLGSKGALVANAHQEVYVPAFSVERIVDPFGAGDAFAAGLITGLLEGLSLEEAGRIANAMGALALGVTGNIEALPYRDELIAFMSGNPTIISR
jgi:2-dehydro-3-deoxygluconokinase